MRFDSWRLAAPVVLVATTAAQTVTPTSITSDPSDTCGGGVELHNVCITLPPESVVDKADIFLLFDDTGSFAGTAPALIALFQGVVDDLVTALPGVDLAFGVGRFEDFGGPGADFSGESSTGRPFVLNQAILRTSSATFMVDLNAALARTAPGFGGDSPESAIAEGLWQVASGVGFDGNGNGSTLDSGVAGAVATQTAPGTSGDVPAFASYVGTGDGSLGGVGWRPGSLKIVLLATDICPVSTFTFPDPIPATISGTGSTEPVTTFACTSIVPGSGRFGYVSDSKSAVGNTVPGAVAPSGAGTVQGTISALNALGIRVIGLAPGGAPTSSPGPSSSPSVFLSALARLTGAVDAMGDPLVFNISGGSAAVAAAIVNAVTTTSTTPIDIVLTADPALPGLTMTTDPLIHVGVAPGDTVCFDVTFTGDAMFAGGMFDLDFRDALSNSIVGTIPTSLVCGAEDCFVIDFQDGDSGPLDNGEHINTEFTTLFTLSSSGANAGLGIFDSTVGGPNDPSQDLDLLVDTGNILILQTENFPPDANDEFPRPNDASDGGTMTFSFTAPVMLNSIRLVDADNTDGSMNFVVLTDWSGLTRTYTVPVDWTGDRTLAQPGQGTLDLQLLTPQSGFGAAATAVEDAGFDFTAVSRLDVHLAGSGGVDDLSFCRGAGFSRTHVALQNGTGRNPRILRSWSAPILGGTWVSGLDCSGHAPGLSYLGFYSQATPPSAHPWGEVLVGGVQYLLLARPHTGHAEYFALDLPPNLALLGVEVHSQGLCLDRPGPRLSNALTARFGF